MGQEDSMAIDLSEQPSELCKLNKQVLSILERTFFMKMSKGKKATALLMCAMMIVISSFSVSAASKYFANEKAYAQLYFSGKNAVATTTVYTGSDPCSTYVYLYGTGERDTASGSTYACAIYSHSDSPSYATSTHHAAGYSTSLTQYY